MDYAKYSYIKLSELETQTQSENSLIQSAIEIDSGAINPQIVSTYDYDFGNFSITGKTYIQIKAMFNSILAGEIGVELLAGDMPLVQETRTIDGQTQVILMKTFEPSLLGDYNICLRVKILSESFSCQIENCQLVTWGCVASNKTSGMCMRLLSHDGGVLVSYAHNNQIFMATSPVEKRSLDKSDFILLASGISHSFAVDKQNRLYFFRVDASGNLFYSKYSNLADETKIDSSVSVVFARKCNEKMPEDILICYIKDGRPMYCCMTNGIVASSTEFSLPLGEFSDIQIVDAPESDQMFVVCKHKNLSNYIMHTVDEKSIENFVENLSATIVTAYKTYLDVYPNKEDSAIIENLSAKFICELEKGILIYDDILQNQLIDNLKCLLNFCTEQYEIKIFEEINYELSFSQLDNFAEGQYRVTYGADCKDWTHATLDVSGSGILSDPDEILKKWPFSEIKPCLMKDGEVIGYLDPSDYSKFENGTDADITNPNYDVMVQFPKIYYKIEQDWDGNNVWNKCEKADVKIYISNVYKDGYVCLAHTKNGVEYNNIYISAYENFIPLDQEESASPKVLCCSGLKPENLKLHKWILDNIEQCKGYQYTTFHYHIATMLQILSMLLFQEHEGGYTWGQGYYGSEENMFNTGCANTAGMFYALNKKGENYCKLFGLENIMGHCHVVLDGMLTDNDYYYYIYDPTNPDCKLGYEGKNFYSVPQTIKKSNFNDFLCRVSADSQYGFLPVSHVPVESYGVRYYNARNTIKGPKNNAGDFITRCETGEEYMVYNFGGGYKDTHGSLFSYISMHNRSDSDKNAERLICYPDQEKS